MRNRSSTPQTEPFPPLEPAPRTPTSLSSIPRHLIGAAIGPPPHLKPYNVSLADRRASLSPKIAAQGPSPRQTPRPLTGAAAVADARRCRQLQEQEQIDSRQTSPNPAVTALNSLMSGPGMSKPSDGPTVDRLSEPMRKAAEHLTVPVSSSGGESSHPSPISFVSFGAPENPGASSAMTATAIGADRGSTMVEEPGEMTETPDYEGQEPSYDTLASNNYSNKASTYPGPITSSHGQESSRSSPSTKRHKCPYCSTDFTRHHNLKSHLLTHSQEKPYVCQTCQSRFRRLHDLKRHTKLHTGERPHTCDKCGRRFARGDALARHNKGPGGCAGRRSSFGGDDDGGIDDTMEGLEYDQGDDDADEDERERRDSEPHRKRAHVETTHDASREVYRQHSSTYPPIQGRPLRSNMGPPNHVLPSSGTATSPGEVSNNMSPMTGSISSQYYGAPPPAVAFGGQQGAMTESPKPLSPGQPEPHRMSITEASNHYRNRSASLTQQYQQQHFGRGPGQGTPPMHGHLPSQHIPTLPSLPGLAPGHTTRLPIQSAAPTSMLQHQHNISSTSTLPSSNPGSYSSHGQSSVGSTRDMVGDNVQDLWNYVRSLEQRFSRMQDEYELRISRLQEDLISVKGHLKYQSR